MAEVVSQRETMRSGRSRVVLGVLVRWCGVGMAAVCCMVYMWWCVKQKKQKEACADEGKGGCGSCWRQ